MKQPKPFSVTNLVEEESSFLDISIDPSSLDIRSVCSLDENSEVNEDVDESTPLLLFTSSTPIGGTTTTSTISRQYGPCFRPQSRMLPRFHHPHCQRAVSLDAIHRCFYQYGPINVSELVAAWDATITQASDALVDETKQISRLQAVFIMTNCVIDMGLLNFPYALKTAGGIRNALSIELIILVLIFISLYMVGYCAQFYSSPTYQAMVRAHCGGKLATFCKICIFLNNFTACILFLVVLGDQLERVVSMTVNENLQKAFYLQRGCLVPILGTIFILPMTSMKNFGIFRYTGFLGILAALYIAFGVSLVRYITGTSVTVSSPQSSNDDNSSNLDKLHWLRVLSIFLFAYECHIEIPPLYSCLKKPSLSSHMIISTSYTVLAFSIYTTVAVFAYLTFGDLVSPDFLLSYPNEDVLVMVAMALLAVKIACSYPVVFFCVRIIGEEVACRPQLRELCGELSESTRRYGVSLILFSTSVIISVLIPIIAEIIALVGGIAALFLFFFPGICYASIYRHVFGWKGMANFMLGILFAILGVVLAILTTCIAVYDYTTPHDNYPSHNVTANVTQSIFT